MPDTVAGPVMIKEFQDFFQSFKKQVKEMAKYLNLNILVSALEF